MSEIKNRALVRLQFHSDIGSSPECSGTLNTYEIENAGIKAVKKGSMNFLYRLIYTCISMDAHLP